MTGEDTGDKIPAELEGLSTEGFTKDELEQLLEGDGTEPEGEPESVADVADGADAKSQEESGGKPDEHPKGYVPNQALREEREKGKALRDELAEMRRWQARLAEKLADHRSQQTSEPGPAEPEPIDPNEDPMGYIRQVGEQVAELAKSSQRTNEEQQQAQQRLAQEQQIIDNVASYREELGATDPETAKAFDFAVEKTVEAYRRHGYAGNALREAVKTEVLRYATNAPADPEELKHYTMQNAWFWGYGQQPPSEQKPAKEQVASLQSAQNAAKTLSGGGSSGNMDISLEDIEKMTGSELDRIALEDPDLFARIERSFGG